MDKLELPQIPLEVLQSWPKEAQEYVAGLQKLLEPLLLQNQQLLQQLNQNSHNSSKPPSSDPPFTRPPKNTNQNAKTKSGKVRGGQAGHTKHERTLLDPTEVDLMLVPPVPVCANPQCGTNLTIHQKVTEGVRVQVWELPQVKAHVTEYRLPTYQCQVCHTHTRATLPTEMPPGQFGPQLVATLAVLHGQYQLSLRQIQRLALDLWQLPLSVGAISEACNKATQALAQPYEQVFAQVQTAPYLHLDETGWYLRGKLKWLWAAVSPKASLFQIHSGRGKTELKKLLAANYTGYIHTDRWQTYLTLEASRHQLCWAHLIRNLRGLAQRAGPAKEWGEKLLSYAHKLFVVWHDFLDSEGEDSLRRAKLVKQVRPIRADFKAGLREGVNLADKKVSKFCKKLLAVEERLYVFVKEEGLSPTNNTAERALRPAVIWRKKCYGNQSAGGETFVERVLSVGATCQQLKRPFLQFVKECLRAKWFSLNTPSLFSLSPPL